MSGFVSRGGHLTLELFRRCKISVAVCIPHQAPKFKEICRDIFPLKFNLRGCLDFLFLPIQVIPNTFIYVEAWTIVLRTLAAFLLYNYILISAMCLRFLSSSRMNFIAYYMMYSKMFVFIMSWVDFYIQWKQWLKNRPRVNMLMFPFAVYWNIYYYNRTLIVTKAVSQSNATAQSLYISPKLRH